MNEIRLNMLAPAWGVHIEDAAGPRRFDLAESIRIIGMRECDTTPVIDTDNVAYSGLTGTANGDIHYQWQVGDTDTIGPLDIVVIVTWPGGVPEEFPAKGAYRTVVHR